VVGKDLEKVAASGATSWKGWEEVSAC